MPPDDGTISGINSKQQRPNCNIVVPQGDARTGSPARSAARSYSQRAATTAAAKTATSTTSSTTRTMTRPSIDCSRVGRGLCRAAVAFRRPVAFLPSSDDRRRRGRDGVTSEVPPEDERLRNNSKQQRRNYNIVVPEGEARTGSPAWAKGGQRAATCQPGRDRRLGGCNLSLRPLMRLTLICHSKVTIDRVERTPTAKNVDRRPTQRSKFIHDLE